MVDKFKLDYTSHMAWDVKNSCTWVSVDGRWVIKYISAHGYRFRDIQAESSFKYQRPTLKDARQVIADIMRDKDKYAHLDRERNIL